MSEVSYSEPLPLFHADLPISSSLEAGVCHPPFPRGEGQIWGALHKKISRESGITEKRVGGDVEL